MNDIIIHILDTFTGLYTHSIDIKSIKIYQLFFFNILTRVRDLLLF